jgi:hypothetical protein
MGGVLRIPAILTLALLLTVAVVPVAAQHYSVCAGETVRHEAWDNVTITQMSADPEPSRPWNTYYFRGNEMWFYTSSGYFPEGDGDQDFVLSLNGFMVQQGDAIPWEDDIFVQVRQCDSMWYSYEHHTLAAGETLELESDHSSIIRFIGVAPRPVGSFGTEAARWFRFTPDPEPWPEGDAGQTFEFKLGMHKRDDHFGYIRRIVVDVELPEPIEHFYSEREVRANQAIALGSDYDRIDSLISVSPEPVGSYELSSNRCTFTPDQARWPLGDVNQEFEFVLAMFSYERQKEWIWHLTVSVIEPEYYDVRIGMVKDAIQGRRHTVPVTVEQATADLWGFDILVGYEAGPLTFTEAREGNIFSACAWEYFNYRFGPGGNCDDRCPAGLLRVIGIAETNNGAAHPQCYRTTTPFTLCALDFLLTDDRNYEGAFLPISFFWMDCGNNSLAIKRPEDPDRVIQAISRQVLERTADSTREITDSTVGYFTYTGASSECLDLEPDRPVPERLVDFVAGGIDIMAADSIDPIGDVNLNSVPNEIADAVLLTNYFVHGPSMFSVNPPGQVQASDVNRNGTPLEVADMVYLIRILTGDAVPSDQLDTGGTVGVYFRENILSVDKPVGAAWIIVKGDVVPTLLAEHMDIKYAYDEGVTRILVYSMCADSVAEGQILRIDSDEVESMEFSSYYGAPLQAEIEELPIDFEVQQNYPNPFNPGTHIRFDLPRAGQYSVTIYDILGRQLEVIRNSAEAGTVDVYWDGSNYSSGVYFYRVEYDGRVSTRKMLLLK